MCALFYKNTRVSQEIGHELTVRLPPQLITTCCLVTEAAHCGRSDQQDEVTINTGRLRIRTFVDLGPFIILYPRGVDPMFVQWRSVVSDAGPLLNWTAMSAATALFGFTDVSK